ncbi:MAG: cytidylyltransferase domain-containing protein [Gaiellaceae bacterium]
MTNDRLALVPARGGSRSIPLKNVKPLGGRPLIEWVLGAIAASGSVDRIVVSTDDERIADVARAAGADVPFLRPPELAGDDTPSIPVIEHALEWLEQAEDYRPEHVLFLQPTEPFVRPEQIRAAFDLMISRQADSAITVVPVPRNFHPFHVRVERDGLLEFEQPVQHYGHPTRQSDPPRYAFGNLYWFRRESFLRERRLEAGRRVGLPIDPVSALDLNTEEEWRLAELLAGELG